MRPLTSASRSVSPQQCSSSPRKSRSASSNRTASTMRAERFYADTKKVVLEDVPIPEPGPGEVLVKVAFCGICHSDLSLINGTFPSQLPVVTQGHEASGTVAKLGPGVTGWAEGDRVVVAAGKPCMACTNCHRGDVSNCLRIR